MRRYLTLGNLQRSTEEALISLRLAPDHFVRKLVETHHAGVDDLYEMSKPRLGETDEFTQRSRTSAQYLAKTVHLIQSQARMEQRTYALSKFLDKLYARYPDLDEVGLILYNRALATTIKWDLRKMHQLLYQTYGYLKRQYPQVVYSYLHVRDTRLKYPGLPQAVPAVAITFSFHTKRPRIAPVYTYTERVEDPYLGGNPKLQELHTLADKHYSLFEMGKSALIVVPLKLNKVRPQLIEDDQAPETALQNELLRRAKASEVSFWTEISAKPHHDIRKVEQVVHFMKAAHQHQTRKNNDP